MSKGLLNFQKNKAPETGDKNETKTPTNGMPFTVDILELMPSRMNPRKTHGKSYEDDYESLKASIKNVGLQSTLTVTKVDEQEKYELYNGGNTRLRVLTELYEEFLADGDTEKADKYRYQQVIFVPYTDDLDVLVKHMAENEERINMTFIDKARAVFQIKELYLKKNNADEISNRQLVKYIHELGWTSVSQQAMTELSFAFEKLDAVIPLSLNSGMGKSKIQQLRVWLSYTEKYLAWLLTNNDYTFSFEQAEDIYFNTLAEYDDDIEPIDLNGFYEDYIFKLSQKLVPFDSTLKFEQVKFELSNVEEYGKVLEERPRQELSDALKETATVPPMTFPESKQPRIKSSSEPSEVVTQDAAKSGISSLLENTESPIGGLTGIAPLPESSKNETTETGDISKQCMEQAVSVIRTLLTEHDLSGRLKQYIQYGDFDNDVQAFAPFFNLHIDTTGYEEITNIILSGEWAEQYTTLHFLHISSIYYDVAFSDLTVEEEQTHKFIKLLMKEYSVKYCQYLGLCQTSLININKIQRDSMMKVHELTKKHIALIELDERNSEAEGE